MHKLKRSIDACSNPPYFRGVSTPITDLLDSAEPKVAKQKRDQTKAKAEKTKDNKANPKPNETPKGDHKHPHIYRQMSIDKVNLLQMDKLNNSADVLQKPTLNGTLSGTSLKYLNMV